MSKINRIITCCLAGAMVLASTSVYANVYYRTKPTMDQVIIRTETPCSKGCDLVVDTTLTVNGEVVAVQVVSDSEHHCDEAVDAAVAKAKATVLGDE